MVDTRFHRFAGPVALGALLEQIGLPGLVDGSEAELIISGVAELDLAGPNDLALAAHTSYIEELRRTNAGAVFVSGALRDVVPAGTVGVAADKAHNAFADVLDFLYPSSTRSIIAAGRDDLGAPIFERDVTIGSNVVIGAGVEIGRGTIIGANTVIGAGVTIGRNCTIAANCTIDCAHIGNDVVLHSGVRIGTEGFGWLDFGSSNRKIPQLGRVIIQDRVEVGANSTIDRGALGDTVIGDGTKIDNLVQIGHNVAIGRHCVIVSQVGISGSATLGDFVVLGGQVGVNGHVTIGHGAQVAATASVKDDLAAGGRYGGAPARPIKEWYREELAIRRLAQRASARHKEDEGKEVS